MHICFLLLLAALAQAAPFQETPKLHKLALRRTPSVRDGEHHLIAFQRHLNSAAKRHARMTGGEEPLPAELHRRMVKRAESLTSRAHFDGYLDRWQKESEGGDLAAEGAVPSRASAHNLIAASAAPKAADKGEFDRHRSTALTLARSLRRHVQRLRSNPPRRAQRPTRSPALGSALAASSIDYAIQADDVGYVAQMQFGTPPRSFWMLIDSGSADTWIPSEACTTCGPHQAIGSNSSSTHVSTRQEWNITYGSGSASGLVVQDTVGIAGMQLQNHSFGVTLDESSQFSNPLVPFDGLAGTALSSLSKQGVPTFTESLLSSGQIEHGIMGYALGRVADGHNSGELSIGGSDPTRLNSSTTQTLTNTNAKGFWQATVSAISVDGQVSLRNRQAILDTGTTLIFAPKADADALHGMIEGASSDGQGGYTLPCTFNQTISMTFGDHTFSIDPRDITFLPVDSSNPRGDCKSSIVTSDSSGKGTWLVGDAFLKNVYFATDIASNRIQLSERPKVDAAAAAAPETTAAVADGVTSSANGTISSPLNETVGHQAALAGAATQNTKSRALAFGILCGALGMLATRV